MEEVISKDERTWGLFCHLSAFAFFVIPFGHILGPLIIWLIKKDESKFIYENGKEALNFQISITIYGLASILLIIILIGIPILIGLFILDFILVIIAAVKANDGIVYKYPLSINLLS
jgi:uncharacterized Tic20 family protein